MTYQMNASDGLLKSQLSRQLNREGFEYWNSIRGHRAMPRRADFDPFAIPRILHSVLFIEVLRPEIDFLYRVVGSRWAEAFGRNDTGRRMSELPHQRQPSQVWSAARHVVDTGRPLLPDVPYVGRNAAFKEIEVLIMPLSGKTDQVDYLLVTIDFLRFAPGERLPGRN